MKRQIKAAIKAAGLNADDFIVRSNEYESKLSSISKGNAQMNKVAKALRAAGIKISGYKTGYGAWIYKTNEIRHAGHDLPFGHQGSIHHY